jgi:hypothetical protein
MSWFKKFLSKTKQKTITTSNIISHENIPVVIPTESPKVKPRLRESFHIAPLYVILPYFNYCHYESRKKLFLEFIERYISIRNLKIVIVEGTYKDTPFQLPEFTDKIFLHIKVELSDRIWIKENLINIAIRNLPSDWYNVAWIDADLTFINDHWVSDTIEMLKTHDVIQLFQTAINMGPSGEALKIENSFLYMYLKSGKPYHKSSKYGVWHPGYAWACTRHAYYQLGGLLDFGILGSGDRHMALAFIGQADVSYPGTIHPKYQEYVMEYQKKALHLKLGFVPGTILHHFHGSLTDRKYVDRWNILINHQYDPSEDIYHDKNHLLKLTEKGKRLQEDIDHYFKDRKEDGTVV